MSSVIRKNIDNHPVTEWFSKNAATSKNPAKAALFTPMAQAIAKRPAPDLIYREALENTKIHAGTNKISIKKGDLVILSLVGATQGRMASGGAPNLDIVFGGHRKAPIQKQGDPVHACPAYRMSVGTMMGVIAALLDSGRIQSLPASMIVKITDWQR